MEGPLELGLLDVLLVLDLLLDILVALEQLVVLRLSQLETFVQVGLELLLKRVHLVLLLLNQSCFGGDDLLVATQHICFPLVCLHFLALDLDLVRLLILLLLCEVLLNPLLVQQLGAELESQWKSVLQLLAIRLDLDRMSILQLAQCLAVLFLSLQQVLVPLLVELLILLDVRLLTLLALLRLIEDELLRTTIKVLLLQFVNTIFGHLSLDVLAFTLARVHVVL